MQLLNKIGLSKNFLRGIIASAMVLCCIGFVFRNKFSSSNEHNRQNNQLILEWYDLFLRAERFSEGYRVPVAARTTGYIGLAAYETSIPAFESTHLSYAESKLNLNIPNFDANQSYHLLAALNACYKKMFDKFYITLDDNVQIDAEKLFNKWEIKFRNQPDLKSYEDSKKYGAEVANSIYEYSATDSIGHQAYLHIYDKRYIPKSGEGLWKVSEEFPMPPLLPGWGETRPLVINTQEYLATPLPEYSLLPDSKFYTEALEVLTVSSPLSLENKWIAEFWSDDHPGLTFTPSGRWISIVNQVIEKECPPIEKTLETYLKVGFGLMDGAIACWYSKYHYNFERPEAYIHKVFDKNWKPLFHSPPFPGYPSGHSVFGGVAAEILTQLYGPNYQMKDYSHKGRDEFMSKPRMFHSFYDMAFENAFSRISLGVHFRIDCEEGLRIGFQMGKKISDIELMKPEYSYNK
jgi:hypothetical protein